MADFGFSVYMNHLQDLTPTEKFVGTPGFSPPELFRRESYDERIDNFSIGVILYYLLSGKFPFSGTTIEQIEQYTLRGNVCLNSEKWAAISDGVPLLLLRPRT